jgi:hypothetical protein
LPFVHRSLRTMDGLAADACRELLQTLPEVSPRAKPGS